MNHDALDDAVPLDGCTYVMDDELGSMTRTVEAIFASDRFDDRERHVVTERWWGRTLRDVGDDPQILRSPERVRQIEAKAWRKLRAALTNGGHIGVGKDKPTSRFDRPPPVRTSATIYRMVDYIDVRRPEYVTGQPMCHPMALSIGIVVMVFLAEAWTPVIVSAISDTQAARNWFFQESGDAATDIVFFEHNGQRYAESWLRIRTAVPQSASYQIRKAA